MAVDSCSHVLVQCRDGLQRGECCCGGGGGGANSERAVLCGAQHIFCGNMCEWLFHTEETNRKQKCDIYSLH